MIRLLMVFGVGSLLGSLVLCSYFDGWSTPLPLNEIRGRDQKASDRTASFLINERPFDQVFYSLNLTIGTPPQDVVLAMQPLCPINTWIGSQDGNYANVSNFGFPVSYDRPYVFDGNVSSTAQEDNSSYLYFGYYSFNIRTDGYGIGLVDNISIGDVSLGRREITLVTEGDRTPGDLCLDDLGSWLKNASMVDEEVFSISLDGSGIYSFCCYRTKPLTSSVDSAPGHIVFGGVDTEKFQGSLVLLPALTELDFLGEDRNVFNLESMTIMNGSETVELLHAHPNASFELDHGDFGCTFPPDVVDSIYDILGGAQFLQADQSAPGALVPCSIAQGSLSVNFTFGYNTSNTSISVSVSDLMSTSRTTSLAHNSSKILSSNGTELCLFNILPGSPQDYLVLNHSVFHLGSSALKSVYTVFDKGNRTVGVANAKPDVTSSNIVNYNGGCFPGAQIIGASASSACAPTSTVQTALPTAILTDSPTHVSASPTSTSTSNAPRNNLCTPAMILVASLPILLNIL